MILRNIYVTIWSTVKYEKEMLESNEKENLYTRLQLFVIIILFLNPSIYFFVIHLYSKWDEVPLVTILLIKYLKAGKGTEAKSYFLFSKRVN